MTTKPLKPDVIERGPDFDRDVKGLEHLAWLMDRAFTIPGTRISVGLDAILGLLPVGGDFLTGLIQIGLVLVALHRYNVPRAVATRMAANVLLDIGLGSIPLLGDVFDVFFKANTRNMRLLERVMQDPTPNRAASNRSSILYLALIAIVLVTALALILIGFVAVVAWLVKRPAI